MKKKITVLFLILLVIVSAAACQKTTQETEKELETYAIDEQAETLTIAGAGYQTVVYTVEEFQKMKMETHQYSGRNKTVENARIFETYTGVDLKTLLKQSGFPEDGAMLKLICSDGYTRRYTVDDLYGLYAFQDNKTDEKEEVNPMIVLLSEEELEYPSRFQLVYGQEDYDTQNSMDFNTQGWAHYIQYIEVSY